MHNYDFMPEERATFGERKQFIAAQFHQAQLLDDAERDRIRSMKANRLRVLSLITSEADAILENRAARMQRDIDVAEAKLAANIQKRDARMREYGMLAK